MIKPVADHGQCVSWAWAGQWGGGGAELKGKAGDLGSKVQLEVVESLPLCGLQFHFLHKVRGSNIVASFHLNTSFILNVQKEEFFTNSMPMLKKNQQSGCDDVSDKE